ncbi:hypothetical protein FRC17_002163 [Serendipita sp. 399]|nr:hypothetical protein FRC17_002163 [Serendipita sp. 399]
METEKKLDVQSPISQKTGKPIPETDSVSFPVEGDQTNHYKNVLAAIQEAKEVTGQYILTPWRDAVGDKEKSKDVKKQRVMPETEDGEEEEEEEES